jgi:hypothetical protein
MADLTRRGFLTQTSVVTGVGIVGGMGLRQLLTTRGNVEPTPTPEPTVKKSESNVSLPDFANISLAGPMVVHVRDLASAEVSLMVGPQELVYRDPELVSRLLQTAATTPRTEG